MKSSGLPRSCLRSWCALQAGSPLRLRLADFRQHSVKPATNLFRQRPDGLASAEAEHLYRIKGRNDCAGRSVPLIDDDVAGQEQSDIEFRLEGAVRQRWVACAQNHVGPKLDIELLPQR